MGWIAVAPWFNFATDKVRLGTLHTPAWIISLSTSDKRTSSYISTSPMFCNDVSTNCHNEWVTQRRYSVAKFSNKHVTHTTLHQHDVHHAVTLDFLPNGRDKTNQMSSARGSTENHGDYHPCILTVPLIAQWKYKLCNFSNSCVLIFLYIKKKTKIKYKFKWILKQKSKPHVKSIKILGK